MASVVIYASEQGTAKGIAEEIGQKTGFDVTDIREFNFDNFATYNYVIFVVATYGRGSAPKSCEEAWQKLNSITDKVENMKFAVFGVGSSAFRRSFVGFAKTVENKMKELGATEVTEMGILDEQDEKSTDLNEWMNAL